jgi:signal transduction histidine kinase
VRRHGGSCATARAGEILGRIRSLYTKAPPKRESVDMNEVVCETLELLRGEAGRHAVVMRAELAAGLPPVAGARIQLQQVLMNLMLNGVEAMHGSPGELTVRLQPDERGDVLVSVSDAGVGLPVERTDQLFTPFFTTKPQGSGMGLAISRSIVESHGGRLWATPNAGRGATFHVVLPAGAREGAGLVAAT